MIDIKEQKNARIALASMQQNQASSPQNSVWVEASAGTGKTKVLSDRVLRLLLNGVNPSHILCLTYTKAAASEMNNRIINRLSDWSVIEEPKLCEQLSQLLSLDIKDLPENQITQARRLFAILLDTPGGIKIQTIHSFCQEILKRFPLEAGVSPYFEVMDDRETKEILSQIRQDILSGNKPAPILHALQYLTANTSEYTFPDILASITSNCNLLENYFAATGGLTAALAKVNQSLGLSAEETAETNINLFWQNLDCNQLNYIIQALQKGSDTSLSSAQRVAQAFEERNFDLLVQTMLTAKQEPNKRFLVKKSIAAYPNASLYYEQICQSIITTLNRLGNINLRDSTTAVLTLSSELLRRYQNFKIARSKMDYNDLIVKTAHLLSQSSGAEWVLYKLDGGIDHILIDEAQDTSPEQWQIIQALTREFFAGKGSKSSHPTIFVVGDGKQSIYSFQGADIEEFTSMHDYFAQTAPDFKTVNMDVSFRSTAAILDMVNAVFASPIAARGVSLSQGVHHEPSRIGEGGHVEIWPLTYAESDNTSDDVWFPPVERVIAQSASALLAQKIASTILRKVQSGELKADGTPMRFRDFLILVQQRNSLVDEIVRACKNIGVAIAGVDKIKLLDQIAIMDMLSAAKFAMLPTDDLNLACLLKSPIIGLTDDDLFKLCYDRKVCLWQQICQNPDYQKVADILSNLRQLGLNSRPYEFFAHILVGMDGRNKFVARLGSECEDAIDEFVNLTLAFEQDHIPSLQIFIEWMQSDDMEVKRNLEQSDLDAVRLMTVHGSKGLQAPIVILPDTVRFKSVKQEGGLLHNKQHLFYPLNKSYYNDECADIQARNQQLAQEEYNRLLYVALTRAGEQLYICGYSNSREPNAQSWYNLCRDTLAQIAPKSSDGNPITYHLNSLVATAPKKQDKTATPTVELPKWLHQPAKVEAPLTKPLTPSHQDEQKVAAISPLLKVDNSHLYRRGNIIHKLLQFVPNEPMEKRASAIQTYLKFQAADIPEVEQQKISAEVLSLINSEQFAPLFGPNSSAEVAIMGKVGTQIISGQIDRLVIAGDRVMIVDYKTNRPAAQSLAEVPLSYRKQMQAYRELISQIYPQKKVETYILWTNTAKIMVIE